ncbi:MAG: transglycosylase SLT domain-containing protein, partial [Myxococcales bacterium]|nr:transglycosylase SLT domain-containing protein [Myxococcales bacterium]
EAMDHLAMRADRAAAATRELAIEHPETDEGREAAGRIALTDAERLRRAASFERARDYASAATELTALYGTPLAAEARFEWAKLQLERVREDFDAAEKAFAALAAEPGPFAEESMWLRARALGRKGDVVAALSAFAAYLKRHPKGRFAADARFFSAFLQYEVGRYADAARAFSRLDDPAWRTSARWYHAWCLYLAGDRKAAVPALDAIAAADPRGNEGRKAAYWAARALEKKSPSEAAARMQRLVTARPHDWYGLMARRRAPKRFANIAALPGAPSPPDPPVPIVFAGPVAEIRGLATAGLPDLARRALATLSPLLRSTDGWALEATLAAQIGDAERQMRGTLTRHHALFVDPPRAEDAPIWRAAWPRGHADAVNTAAGRFGVAPSLVFAFIRKESAFAPEAISPAHAVGLMQLLPRTARAIQEARGLGDQPAPDLFEPARNIELGTWYVAALQHRFGGALPLVAAAYNAGPSAVRQWAAGRARVATDLFVDTIPFRETRQYVKRMVETQVLYEMVHGGRDLNTAAEVLPVELDLTIAPGVDF